MAKPETIATNEKNSAPPKRCKTLYVTLITITAEHFKVSFTQLRDFFL